MSEQIANLLTDCRPQFVGMAARILKQRQDAEDCVQDAVVLALRFAGHFRGESSLSTWFGAIVRNCALQYLRHHRDSVSMDDPVLGGDETWGDVLPAAVIPQDRRLEQKQKLAIALGRLTSRADGALLAFCLDGLTLNEIAAQENIPLGTVKARIARARTKVRQSWR